MGVSGGDPAAVRAAVLGWLGPVADGDGAETEARVERVAAAWEALEDASRGRQEDGEAGGRDRGEGAGLYAAGMLTLRQAAAEDLAAAVAAAAARDRRRGAVVAAHALDGVSVAELCRLTRVSRRTVYDWMGRP
mgnify:CR=1 FL=1